MDNILSQLRLPCKRHNHCSYIAGLINDYLKQYPNNTSLYPSLLIQYINYLKNSKSGCIREGKIYVNTIVQLLQRTVKTEYDEQLFVPFIAGSNDVIQIFELLIETMNFTFSQSFLELIFEYKKLPLAKYMLRHINPTPKCMKYLLHPSVPQNLVSDLFQVMLSHKIDLPNNILSSVITEFVKKNSSDICDPLRYIY